MSNITSKELNPNQRLISIQIHTGEVKAEFEKGIKEQARKAEISGFRKGKVPVSLIKKMKGNILLTQSLFQKVEHEMNDFIKAKKIDIVGQPLMINVPEGIEHGQDKKYTFDFEIGLKPKFTVADISKHTITKYQIDITDKIIEEELMGIQRKFGELQDDVEEVKSAEDIIHLDLIEYDTKKATVEGETKTNVLLVKYFKKQAAESIVNKKINYSWQTTLYDAFEKKERGWIIKDLGLQDDESIKNKCFQITITKIGHIKPAELNEDLFKKAYPTIQIKNQENFKKRLAEDLQLSWSTKAEDYINNDLYLYWTKNTKMDLPEEFLKKWYSQRAQQEQTQDNKKPKEKLSTFLSQLKWSLILNNISQAQKFEIDKDKIVEQVKAEVDNYYTQHSQEEKNNAMMQLLNNTDYLYKVQQRLLSNLVFEWASKQAKVEEKKINPDDFLKLLEKLEKDF